ncbi:hypothetical protein QBC36DRAFT_40580 [Triangularia setosa]|uniref:Uncharacterized protein n=1 Tax=Triangularia setosa TaxID=2587417 RepID=A0AAN6WH74_9PEZI|nr:hypothetical protein QBC36DRAFT_40580 [Podospora setosa]
MAPMQYRTAAQTRRGNRAGVVEHDDFEGLPVRQWTRGEVNVAMGPPPDEDQKDDIWAIELPFGMPKDTALLPPHSQELLRAMRSGRVYKRPPPEDEDEDVDFGVKGDKKESELGSEGFTVRAWKQMPRNVEVPSVSHLAKRHKGTITLASTASVAHIPGPTITRATVRRIDAAGNPYEQTITLSEGQQVDGEIIRTTVVPAPVAAAGEALGQHATPVKRRPPPPKRKPKGPGRGRKKGSGKIGQLPLPATRSQQQAAAEGEASAAAKVEGAPGEGPSGVVIGSGENGDAAGQDTEMADNSVLPSDEEDVDEGDEGDEDGEEEGGDEEGVDEEATATPEVGNATSDLEQATEQTQGQGQGQDQDQEMLDSDASEVIRPSSVEEPEDEQPPRRATSEEEVTISKPRFQLGPQFNSPRAEGSPLKNVMVLSPTEPAATSAAANYLDVQSTTVSMDIDFGNTQPHILAPSSLEAPATTQQETVIATGAPVIPEPTMSTTPEAEQPPAIPAKPTHEALAVIEEQPPISPPTAKPTTASEAPAPFAVSVQIPEVSLQPPPSPTLPAVSEPLQAPEAGSPDLLGSLEAELDREMSFNNDISADGRRADAPLPLPTENQEEPPVAAAP